MTSPVDIRDLVPLMREAGRAILEVYEGEFDVEYKADDSPLTEADRRSNNRILEHLASHYPDIPVISEETKATPYKERRHWDRLFLVDPLDGTKEFLKHNGEFTVNVAYIENGSPVAGIVYQPVGSISYFANPGQGAFKQVGEDTPHPISHGAPYASLPDVRVVASRSHLSPEVETFVDSLRQSGKKVDFLSAGSSLKLCLVAEGAADIYPRFGPTMEWDTAAAHAVAQEAGCSIKSHPDGLPLAYNKENLLNPWFIVD